MNINLNGSNWAAWVKFSLTALAIGSLVAGACAAEPASPSELLERAVYSEETKGDLDAAVLLYQQVVEQGKDTQSLAAQAQYRLGVCYYKKKDYAKANEAFEKVLKLYPDQKEIVAAAQEYLSRAVPLQPAPWAQDEEMRYDIRFPSGFRIGVGTYTVHADETNGRKIWRLSSHIFAGVQQLSQVEAEADSMKPIHSRWKHTLIGDSETSYSPGHAIVKLKEKEKAKEIDLTGVVYDNEEAVQLFRRLPLTTNYSTTITVLSGLSGGTIVPFKTEVAGVEKVEVPAGTFECYRLELSIKQTFWVSTDAHRYIIKFEAGGAIAELVNVSQPKLGAPVVYHDSALKLTMSAPAGWIFDRHEADEAKGESKIFIIDPDAIATTMLGGKSLAALEPEKKASLRACAEAGIAEGAKTFKEVKAREDSWTERTVAGQPGLGVVVDFLEGKKKRVGYAVYTFAGENELEFFTYLAAEDFEAFKPKFDGIVGSCKLD
jgi:hypothetical protein